MKIGYRVSVTMWDGYSPPSLREDVGKEFRLII